jgi:hypothetical protein
MAKALLVLALTVAQLGASSGASLYLCLGHDGSVCIDGGPATCQCCESHEVEEPCCSQEHCHRHHHDEKGDRPWVAWQFARDLCGCTHVQICRLQAPAVTKSGSAKTQLQSDPFAIVAPDAISATCVLTESARWRPGGGAPLAPSLKLAVLAAAVLRC